MKHNTQLYFAAKPYSDTSVGNSTIGSKGQHRGQQSGRRFLQHV